MHDLLYADIRNNLHTQSDFNFVWIFIKLEDKQDSSKFSDLKVWPHKTINSSVMCLWVQKASLWHCLYRNDPKFSDKQVWANSADPDQTAPLLLLEEQSDQGLHCLLFHLHLFDEIPQGLASLFEF